jgi:hypothetical protein
MPKSKTNPHQSSFFWREIPQMPGGYYPSGPNPNLRSFIEEHATIYDPNIDDQYICVGRGEQKAEKVKRGKKKKSVGKFPKQTGDVA